MDNRDKRESEEGVIMESIQQIANSIQQSIKVAVDYKNFTSQ